MWSSQHTQVLGGFWFGACLASELKPDSGLTPCVCCLPGSSHHPPRRQVRRASLPPRSTTTTTRTGTSTIFYEPQELALTSSASESRPTVTTHSELLLYLPARLSAAYIWSAVTAASPSSTPRSGLTRIAGSAYSMMKVTVDLLAVTTCPTPSWCLSSPPGPAALGAVEPVGGLAALAEGRPPSLPLPRQAAPPAGAGRWAGRRGAGGGRPG